MLEILISSYPGCLLIVQKPEGKGHATQPFRPVTLCMDVHSTNAGCISGRRQAFIKKFIGYRLQNRTSPLLCLLQPLSPIPNWNY